MDHYKRMAIFSRVVELGSMSAAARMLEMSPSAVSQQIRYLERQSGITLLHRSTRKLTLTEVGERYYFYCQQLSTAAENAQNILESEVETPFGELRIAAPVGLATYFISGLGEWAKKFPSMNLNIQVHDEYIDLIEQRIDLAIRVGEMPDSSYVAFKISEMQMGLYVSPNWINQYGMPHNPNDLIDYEWLLLHFNNIETIKMNFFNRNTHLNIALRKKPKIVINNILLLKEMCEQGYGISILSPFEVKESITQGRLIRILPNWHMGYVNVWAVIQNRGTHSAKVIQAIEYLKENLKV